MSFVKKIRKYFSFLALLNDQKRGKSQQGGLAPSSLQTTVRRARVSRASRAWRVRAARGRAKVGSFAAPRNLKYTTRANISHEEAEQIRARIACTPAYKGVAGINTYAKHVCWRRRDRASWV